MNVYILRNANNQILGVYNSYNLAKENKKEIEELDKLSNTMEIKEYNVIEGYLYTVAMDTKTKEVIKITKKEDTLEGIERECTIDTRIDIIVASSNLSFDHAKKIAERNIKSLERQL